MFIRKENRVGSKKPLPTPKRISTEALLDRCGDYSTYFFPMTAESTRCVFNRHTIGFSWLLQIRRVASEKCAKSALIIQEKCVVGRGSHYVTNLSKIKVCHIDSINLIFKKLAEQKNDREWLRPQPPETMIEYLIRSDVQCPLKK